MSTPYKHESINQPSASPRVSDSTEDCDARRSRGRPAGPEHMSKISLWTGEMPDPTAHLYDPEQIKPQLDNTDNLNAFHQADVMMMSCGLTWTSTRKPSLKVPLRIKLRDVPTRNSSPLPSETALMVPY